MGHPVLTDAYTETVDKLLYTCGGEHTFTYEDDEAIYTAEVEVYSTTEGAAEMTGAIHFLACLHGAGIETPFTHCFAGRKFGTDDN